MAFQPSTPLPPLRPASRPSAVTPRRPRHPQYPKPFHIVACSHPTPTSDQSPSNRPKQTRRAFIAAAVALSLSAAVPKESGALSLAPTPINPYARRRREQAYKEYAKKVEEAIESVAVADFRKVIETGGGGINVSYRIAGFAAFVASALSTAIVHPIDSIKTRMQARGTDIEVKNQRLFDNLYTGITSNILKEAPNAAIYLGVYEIIKNTLLNLEITSFFHDLPLLTFLVAGALGDAIGSVVRVPAEIVNKRLQLGVNDDWLDAAKDAFMSSGGRDASGLTWIAVLLRDVPYGGLQIMLYEFGKQLLVLHPSFMNHFFTHSQLMTDVIVGATAGAVAAMITTPADVLVTRLSVQNPQSYLETKKYMGVASTAQRILQEEGIGGFFRGTLQRGIYYAPLIGLFFALYEMNRGWFAHPETVFAQANAVASWLTSDLRFLEKGLHTAYNTVSPLFMGVIYFLAEQVPYVLSVATTRSNV